MIVGAVQDIQVFNSSSQPIIAKCRIHYQSPVSAGAEVLFVASSSLTVFHLSLFNPGSSTQQQNQCSSLLCTFKSHGVTEVTSLITRNYQLYLTWRDLSGR